MFFLTCFVLRVRNEATLSILLVEGNDAIAQHVSAHLAATMPDITCGRVRRFDEAREALVAQTPDLLLVAESLDDGTCLDVIAFLHQAELSVPAVVRVEPGQETMAMAALRMGAVAHVFLSGEEQVRGLPMLLLDAMRLYHSQLQAERRVQDLLDLLGMIDANITLIKHEINNPLAIISGNAQLLLELSKMIEVDETLVQPIEDIEASSQRISSLLEKLADLRGLIKEVADVDDTPDTVRRL